MTSIAAASGSNYLTPLQKLQAELQSEINSGAINSSDQTALSSALTDISSALESGSVSAPAGGPNLPPGDLKSKIDNLIAGEVSGGKLTSAQATELQNVFKATFADPAAHDSHHGSPAATDTTSSADSTSGSSNTSSAGGILQQLLQSLQNSLSSSSSSSYSASGTLGPGNASTTSVSALLIDYQT